jgi:HAD superfamily hydrolase (TIGR01549 family)
MNEKQWNLEAIILDVDGTLVDSNDLHAEAWQKAFSRFGKDLPFDLIRSQIGKGGDLLVPDLLDAREMQKFSEELKDYRKKLFRDGYLEKVRPFDGTKDVMENLHERGLKLFLASSADSDDVKHFTALIGIGDLIDGSTSSGDVELSKPSPEVFEAALEKLGTPPEKSLVVGDTPYDILAAHRASLPVAAVLSGGFDRTTLDKAEFIFDDLPDLLRRFDEIESYFAAG